MGLWHSLPLDKWNIYHLTKAQFLNIISHSRTFLHFSMSYVFLAANQPQNLEWSLTWSSSSKEDKKISKVKYPNDGDEAFGSAVDVSFSSLSNEDENVVATPKEKSRCTKTTNISLVKNRNIVSKGGI